MNEQPLKPSSPQDTKVNLVDYLIVLAKYSRMIVLTSMAVAVLTYLVLLLVPFKYTATARFIPPQQNMTLSGQLLQGMAVSNVPGADQFGGPWSMAAGMLGLQSPGELYVGILSGYTIADRITERFQLKERFGIKYIEDARRTLEGMTEITLAKDGLISVEVTDKDPKIAADMANAFLEELRASMQKMIRKEAATHLVFLEKERENASVNLAKAEGDLKAFSEKSNVLKIDAQALQMLEYIASLRATIDFKEVELEVLRQKATPYNYDLKEVEAELKGLRAKLKVAESQDPALCPSGDVMIATNRMPALGIEYLRLFREAKYQEGLYTLYCRMVELARLDQTRESAVLYIVDQATPPERRSWPKRILTTLLVTTVTFFLLIFIAFTRELWFTTKQSEANSERFNRLRYYLSKWDREKSWLLFFPQKILSKFRKK